MKKKFNKEVLSVDLKLASDKQPEGFYTTLKHMANPGDIVSTLAAVKKYYEATGRKVIYYQCINQAGQYYPGATHPTTDDKGNMVTVNQKMFEMVKPLVESQEYVHRFEKYEGQRIDLNFDVIRGQTNVNMPHGMLAAWPIYAFPDLACDLSKQWILLPEVKKHPVYKQVEGKIILNFTERYRNPTIDYFFLKAYASDLIFAGTEKEHFLFCNRWNLNISRLEVKDFLELAYALQKCRFLLSNQSLCWNICEAIKKDRILEVCSWADNCQPFIGENSVGFFFQIAVEHYFRLFFNTTLKKPQ